MRHVLLLAGGQGRRFWPRSRKDRPKQFMSLQEGGPSLLQATAVRLTPVVPPERLWVVTSAEYVARVRAELPAVPAAQVIGEPMGLNTAPAIGVAATLMRQRDPEAVFMVQAADHWIHDQRRFRRLVQAAFRHVEGARDTLLVGFRPTRPATGYGYIETGVRCSAPPGMRLHAVKSFKEKPSLAVARRYLARGRYLWNGCMFFWHAETILAAIARFLPDLGRELERLAAAVERGRPAAPVLASAYRRLESISIEHGVVEKLSRRVVLEGDCGWEDIGTWLSLPAVVPVDEAGNCVQGEHLGIDTRDCVVLTDNGIVVTIGVRDLIVVRAGDAVLVLPRDREDAMREVTERLAASPRRRRFL